ncbi:hypothetical protein L7F22_042891 [Adiantum nelumboides]|nr:hypothetical protein [Adiantum nelumboides]
MSMYLFYNSLEPHYAILLDHNNFVLHYAYGGIFHIMHTLRILSADITAVLLALSSLFFIYPARLQKQCPAGYLQVVTQGRNEPVAVGSAGRNMCSNSSHEQAAADRSHGTREKEHMLLL